jgi:hypothetical protein
MILLRIFSLFFCISLAYPIGLNSRLIKRWYQTNFVDQRAEIEWFNLGKCCASVDISPSEDLDSRHSSDLVWVEGLEYFPGDIDRTDDRVWLDPVKVGVN